jgi:PncC family amidohydrolase
MSNIILSIDTVDYGRLQNLKQELGSLGAESLSLGPIKRKLFDCTYDFIRNSCKTVVIIGKAQTFSNYIKNRFCVDIKTKIFSLDGIKWCIVNDDDTNFGREFVSKFYNIKPKFNQVKFGVFGRTQAQLKQLLLGFKYPKSIVRFDITSDIEQCIVQVEISNRVDNLVRQEILNRMTELVMDDLYSVDGTSLLEQVSKLLKTSQKKIAIAESYTAGGIASRLASEKGASDYLVESIVCYSNNSKSTRLGLNLDELNANGAVSETVAYEMAANLIAQTDCDIVVATTGYASQPIFSKAVPIDSRLHKAGRCYLAIGDKQGIRVITHNFEGDRHNIAEKGVMHALFNIYKFLRG